MRTLTLLPPGVYDVLVAQVHDGDTVHVLVPVAVKVRLDGIQAAELSTPKGKDVAAWLKARVEGKWVALDLRGDYKYGGERMGAVSIDGTDVAQQMIGLGLAVPWDGKGPRPVGHRAGAGDGSGPGREPATEALPQGAVEGGGPRPVD